MQPAEEKYNYKYQGQERQDEFNLNWDSFKYRNYDYAIGRFMSVDPLAEDYVYNSIYTFSENRVVDGIELEGLEWVDSHKNKNLIYEIKNGKGSYTKYATTDHKRLGNSLLRTLQGRIQLKKLVNAKIPITTKISSGKGPSTGSSYITGRTFKTIDRKSKKVIKADIVIYEGRINDMSDTIDKYYAKGLEGKLDEQSQLFHENTETVDEKIASVVGHEIEHAANEKNYYLSSDKIEITPEAIETKILRQTPYIKPLKTTTLKPVKNNLK